MQGRLNALKAFQYLEGQRLVQKARTPPDQTQQCNPIQVSPCYQEPLPCTHNDRVSCLLCTIHSASTCGSTCLHVGALLHLTWYIVVEHF
jgi:hypothetical protein